MATTTNLSTLKINYLTQAQYDAALTNSQINADELYMTPDTIETATPTITRTAGATISSVTFKRSGHIAQLRFVMTYSTSVAAGANLFTGTLASGYRPSMDSAGCGFYGSSSIIGILNTDGSITIRNASTAAVTISSGAAVAFTYIID